MGYMKIYILINYIINLLINYYYIKWKLQNNILITNVLSNNNKCIWYKFYTITNFFTNNKISKIYDLKYNLLVKLGVNIWF